jgi:MinD superfamily P-loop ATPase
MTLKMGHANSEGMPILMEIPFDRKIAETYSTWVMLVEAMPEWKGARP